MNSALSTLGKVTSATRSKAEELWQVAAAKGFTMTRLWGIGTKGTEHPTGRALDLMITGKGLGEPAGDFLAGYLWANRRRLQVKWLIWDGHIRSTSPGKSGNWEKYYGSNPHVDHVHVYFGTGGYVAPPKSSGGSGAKPKPKVSLKALLAAAKADPGRKQGGTTSGSADDVKIVEAALVKEKLLDAKWAKDGSFGTYTKAAYCKWQERCGYEGKDADGLPGEKSLKSLAAKHGFTVVS